MLARRQRRPAQLAGAGPEPHHVLRRRHALQDRRLGRGRFACGGLARGLRLLSDRFRRRRLGLRPRVRHGFAKNAEAAVAQEIVLAVEYRKCGEIDRPRQFGVRERPKHRDARPRVALGRSRRHLVRVGNAEARGCCCPVEACELRLRRADDSGEIGRHAGETPVGIGLPHEAGGRPARRAEGFGVPGNARGLLGRGFFGGGRFGLGRRRRARRRRDGSEQGRFAPCCDPPELDAQHAEGDFDLAVVEGRKGGMGAGGKCREGVGGAEQRRRHVARVEQAARAFEQRKDRPRRIDERLRRSEELRERFVFQHYPTSLRCRLSVAALPIV